MATSPELRRAHLFLKNSLSLPDGYKISIDDETDNILITSPRLGFCITGVYVREHPQMDYLSIVQKNVEHLRTMTDDPDLVSPFHYPRAEFTS